MGNWTSNSKTATVPFQECALTIQGANQTFSIFFTTDAALNMLFTVTTIFGNILSLIALRKTKFIDPPTKLLLCNLAITDLGIGLVVHPLKAACELRYRWQLIPDVYMIYASVASAFISASLMTTTMITIGRLLALCLLTKYRQVVTLKRTVIVIILVWVTGVLYGAVFVFNRIVYSVLALLGMTVCTLVTSACFIAIFVNLRGNRLTSQEQNTRRNFKNTRYKYTVHTVLYIFIALLLCYLPYIFLTIFARFTMRNKDEKIQLAFILTQTIVFLNSSLNPLLYCWRIPELRKNKKIHCCSSSTEGPDETQLQGISKKHDFNKS